MPRPTPARAARPSRKGFFLLLASLSLAAGCDRSTSEEAPPDPAAPAAAPAVTAARPPLSAGETSHIPVGSFRAGSRPGDPGRRPEIEPRETTVQLGPYRIDRLPYPNDPAVPPRLGVSREAAMRLCAEREGRLCTELEWERACKGPESSMYPTGPDWSAGCDRDPTSCPNAFEVLAMGTLLEWTASDVVPPRGESKPVGPVLRGAPPNLPGAERRCARRVTSEEVDASQIGFRCCYGTPNGAKLTEPVLGAAYKKVPLDAGRLKKLLALDPRTAELAEGASAFREPEAVQTVLERRGKSDRKGFDFTVSALEWSPERGATFLVVPGRSGKDTSFVLVYHVVGDDEHRLAASFIMRNEPGPVALAYSDSIRPRLHFSTCWGCPGETGKILFRPPESVGIFQP